MALAVLNKLEFPLAAPSANPFGSISPTDASHVENYFKNRLEIILDGGSCEKGVESTIVGFENNQATLYRYGSISVEEIEAVVGPLLIAVNKNSEPNAPGMLSRHYAPQTETFLTNRVLDLMQSFPEKRIGILAFKDTMLLPEGCVQEILSATGDLHEAAQKLYAALHRLDKSDMDLIIAERLPDYGLGKTINDRLERATKKMKK
jgi:L-threonylcarbamoyladenylate synthase